MSPPISIIYYFPNKLVISIVTILMTLDTPTVSNTMTVVTCHGTTSLISTTHPEVLGDAGGGRHRDAGRREEAGAAGARDDEFSVEEETAEMRVGVDRRTDGRR